MVCLAAFNESAGKQQKNMTSRTKQASAAA
jgi:hypothetical protein